MQCTDGIQHGQACYINTTSSHLVPSPYALWVDCQHIGFRSAALTKNEYENMKHKCTVDYH